MRREEFENVLMQMDDETFEEFLKELPKDVRDIIAKQRFFLKMFNDESFYNKVYTTIAEEFVKESRAGRMYA